MAAVSRACLGAQLSVLQDLLGVGVALLFVDRSQVAVADLVVELVGAFLSCGGADGRGKVVVGLLGTGE